MGQPSPNLPFHFSQPPSRGSSGLRRLAWPPTCLGKQGKPYPWTTLRSSFKHLRADKCSIAILYGGEATAVPGQLK